MQLYRARRFLPAARKKSRHCLCDIIYRHVDIGSWSPESALGLYVTIANSFSSSIDLAPTAWQTKKCLLDYGRKRPKGFDDAHETYSIFCHRLP